MLVCGIKRKGIAYMAIVPGVGTVHSRLGWIFVPRLHVQERLSQGLLLCRLGARGISQFGGPSYVTGILKRNRDSKLSWLNRA